VYVGNLSYDVKYRDLIEFMRGGGLGRFSSRSFLAFLDVVVVAERRRLSRSEWWWPPGGKRSGAGAGAGTRTRRHGTSSVVPVQWESDPLRRPSLLRSCEDGRGRADLGMAMS